MKSLKNLSGDSLEQMIDYKVVDQNGDEIGTLHSLWSDPDTGTVEFLGVKTGWLFGHNHVVPAEKAELDEANNVVRLPYTESFIKDAPSMSAESEISEAEEQNIFRYYGTHSDTETSDSIEAPYVDPATLAGGVGTNTVADAAGSAGEAGSGGRLRRTQARPDTIDGTASATVGGEAVDEASTMSAASVSPDTTRDQLPTSAPAATYPTANLYGSTGNSTIPTGVASPATTGVSQSTSTTGVAGRGDDTAGGTDPELSETAGSPVVGRTGKAEDEKA